MSFKVNPYSFRVNSYKNWRNSTLPTPNNRFPGLPKNVALESFIKQFLYEKEIYVASCQSLQSTSGQWHVFINYFSFKKFHVHKVKKPSNLQFAPKFDVRKSVLGFVNKNRYFQFLYTRYLNKLVAKKTKMHNYTKLLQALQRQILFRQKNKICDLAALKYVWLRIFKKLVCALTQKSVVRRYRECQMGNYRNANARFKKLRWFFSRQKKRQKRSLADSRIKLKKLFNAHTLVCEEKTFAVFLQKQIEYRLDVLVTVTTRNCRRRFPPALNLLNKKVLNAFSFRLRNIFLVDLIKTFHLAIYFKNPELVLRHIALNLKDKRRRQGGYLKQVCSSLIKCYLVFGSLRGFKLQVKGRLNKSLRTQTFVKSVGRLPTQTVSADISHHQIWTTDRVGSYSLQL